MLNKHDLACKILAGSRLPKNEEWSYSEMSFVGWGGVIRVSLRYQLGS